MFNYFPEVSEAVEVTFQMCVRLSRYFREGKLYLDKHKLYSVKVEEAIRPIVLDLNCSKPYPDPYPKRVF